MISSVVFDLFGTLTGGEARRNVHVASLAEILGADAQALNEWLRSTYDERARGVFGGVREQIVAMSEHVGGSTDPSVIDEAVAIRMDGQLAVLAPRTGTLEVLRALRDRRLPVGVLSDCTAEIPALWPDSPYAPLVDAAVFSCEVGTRKPDPRMYATVLSRLGATVECSLYVGDGGSSELTGASAVGMRAVLLRIEEERHFRADEEQNWHGETIGDLESVLTLLD
ncbi:MAG: HAD family hydrolase [Acidimicrobiales bacterium]